MAHHGDLNPLTPRHSRPEHAEPSLRAEATGAPGAEAHGADPAPDPATTGEAGSVAARGPSKVLSDLERLDFLRSNRPTDRRRWVEAESSSA
jgi:hypothetical protein